MPRGCFGTCGCLAGTARAVVDSPLGCCCGCSRKNSAHPRRFLEYFSRFHQVNHLKPTAAVDNINSSNSTANMRGVSSPRVHCNRPNLRLLVCSANLGNEQPNAESISKWIPPDGFFVEDPVGPDGSNHIMENGEDDDEEGEEASERSLRPYNTKYPLRHRSTTTSTDCDKDLTEFDELIMMDSLSRQLDLIVIGLQEATFDPPKSDSTSDSGVIRIRVPKVPKTFKKLQTLRAAKDFASERNAPELYKTSSSLSSSNVADMTSTARDFIATGLQTILQDEWEDGTHALHSLFEARLPSYTRLVSYQRGQMRLIVFGRTRTADPTHDPVLPLQVLHTAAQNTGRAGLANKGGIVTEILVNGCTRLSFITCHLEAHEGASKCAIRCQSLADILHGTAPRKKHASSMAETEEDDNLMTDSAHVVSPSLHSANPSSHMALDVSMTSHFSFVLGDLNFRTDLSFLDQSLAENEEAHKKSVVNMVEAQDWDGLNNADELHRALLNKDCLVGFKTLQCNFPPTFKVERQAGYQYIQKRRPSYTDRVLFKTGHQLEKGLKPILYEPIDDFTTSDHKPVRLACSLDLNPSFRMRPRAVRHQSMRWNMASRAIQEDDEPKKRRILSRFLRRPFNGQNDNDLSASSNTSEVVDLSSGQGFGRTGDNLHLFVNNICVILNNGDGSTHGMSGPNPYLVLMTQPEEAIRLPTTNRAGPLKRALRRLGVGKRSTTEHTKDGWPCTSIKSNCFLANWEQEEITCRVSTHTPEGGALDLSGAILFLTVMNGSSEDTLLGTVCFNLVNLIKTSAGIKKKQPCERNTGEAVPLQSSSQHRKVIKKSIFGSIFAGNRAVGQSNESGGSTRGSGFFGFARSNPSIDDDEEDPIASVDICEPLLKDGLEIGTLTCTIEAWWMDDAAAMIVRTPEEDVKAAPAENRRGLFKRTREKQPPTPRAEHRSAIVGT